MPFEHLQKVNEMMRKQDIPIIFAPILLTACLQSSSELKTVDGFPLTGNEFIPFMAKGTVVEFRVWDEGFIPISLNNVSASSSDPNILEVEDAGNYVSRFVAKETGEADVQVFAGNSALPPMTVQIAEVEEVQIFASTTLSSLVYTEEVIFPEKIYSDVIWMQQNASAWIGAQQYDANGNILIGDGLLSFEINSEFVEKSSSVANSLNYSAKDLGTHTVTTNLGSELQINVLPTSDLSLVFFTATTIEPITKIETPSGEYDFIVNLLSSQNNLVITDDYRVRHEIISGDSDVIVFINSDNLDGDPQTVTVGFCPGEAQVRFEYGGVSVDYMVRVTEGNYSRCQ